MRYEFKKIEPKWQAKWEESKIFEAKDYSDKPKFYGLVEFPYPSGAGMHVGHIKAYSSLEVISRKRRMEGYNVLFPIGFDAFGLPTENYAVKTGTHPRVITDENIKKFSNQLRKVHTQIEEILNKGQNIPRQSGLLGVAQAFFHDEKWRSCADVCLRYLKYYPNSADENAVKKMFVTADARAKQSQSLAFDEGTENVSLNDKSLKVFELPAFARFAKKYSSGQVIISEFEPGESFYLIQKGTVQLVKCVNGQNKNLDILKPGEFFGEMAILDNSPRSATCLAVGNVQCLEFNKSNFELLITGNPQIALNILKLFCKRIYDQKRRFKILVIQDTQARVADVFCMLDEMNPPVNPNEKQRRFNVTIQDVAHWAALPIAKTTDEINRFMASRKIEVFENNIIVNNIADMKRIVDTRTTSRQ